MYIIYIAYILRVFIFQQFMEPKFVLTVKIYCELYTVLNEDID